jgi:hypothetical protein
MAVSFHSLFGLPSAMIRIIRRVIRLRRVSDIQTPLAVYQFDIRSKWTTSITAPHIEGVCVESLHGFTTSTLSKSRNHSGSGQLTRSGWELASLYNQWACLLQKSKFDYDSVLTPLWLPSEIRQHSQTAKMIYSMRPMLCLFSLRRISETAEMIYI